MQNVARRVNARFARRYNGAMILATDVGGSKTLIGLFEPAAPRPRLVDAAAVRTLEFGGLPELIDTYLARHRGVALDRLSLASPGRCCTARPRSPTCRGASAPPRSPPPSAWPTCGC